MDEVLTRKIHAYLYRLQDSGSVNMFGATSYIESFFALTRKEAREALADWMENWNEEDSKEALS
jgi:hypothetical protein